MCSRGLSETPGERGRTFDGNLIQSHFVAMLRSTVNARITIGNDAAWFVGVRRRLRRHFTVINLSIGAFLRLRTQSKAANGHLRFAAIVIDLFSLFFSSLRRCLQLAAILTRLNQTQRAKPSRKQSSTDSNWNRVGNKPDKAVSTQCVQLCVGG